MKIFEKKIIVVIKIYKKNYSYLKLCKDFLVSYSISYF